MSDGCGQLPTAPDTVIRVTWKPGHSHAVDRLVKRDDEMSWDAVGDTREWDGLTWRSHIAGFEVLSEPRAVTAKAVLDRASDFMSMDEQALVAGEFGIEYDL